jgi:iron(III) transport system permease protein
MEASAPLQRTVQGGRALTLAPALSSALAVAFIGGTLALVLYPLLTLLVRTFFEDSSLQLDAFPDALQQPALGEVLLNTLLLIACSGAIALVIGAGFAWLNERTDAGVPWLTDVLPIIPLMVPTVAGVIGWVMLLAPGAGFINVLLRRLLDIEAGRGPLDIYTWYGLIFVTVLHLVPYVYLVLSAALRNLDASYEEASRMIGAGPLRTLLRVTLPAIAPALVSAMALVIILGIALFSITVIIGTGARIEVLAVRIFRLLSANYPPRTDVAAVLSIFMLVLVQAVLLLQATVSRMGRYARVGGQGFRASPVRLGGWRWVARAFMGLYILAATVLPVLALALVSIQPFWSADIDWSKLTLNNYVRVILDDRIASTALRNSLLLAMGAATAVMVAMAVLAQVMRGVGPVVARLLGGVAGLPAALPHTVIGVAFLVAFIREPINLYGTVVLLLLAYMVEFMPQASQAAQAAVQQVGQELVDASRITGASPLHTFRRVILPIAMPGLVAGWVIVFALLVSELTVSALLAGPGNPVIGFVILNLWEHGTFPALAAMALVMTAVTTTMTIIALRLGRGRLRWG